MRALVSIFENYEIFAISRTELNKLSNDTTIIKSEVIFFLLFIIFYIGSILINISKQA